MKAAGQTAVGVRFQADFTTTSNVAIQGSRFFGPMSAGIQLEGDIDNLSIRDCIFAEAEAGVGIQSTGDTPTFRDERQRCLQLPGRSNLRPAERSGDFGLSSFSQ